MIDATTKNEETEFTKLQNGDSVHMTIDLTLLIYHIYQMSDHICHIDQHQD